MYEIESVSKKIIFYDSIVQDIFCMNTQGVT